MILPALLNRLEPEALIRTFLRHPPQDFRAWLFNDTLPVFAARFDLLTTAEPGFRQTVMRLPLYRQWGKWLQPRTCFVGTTVSEYMLLPADTPAAGLVAGLRRELTPEYPFLIIKDIPQDSPLLDAAANSACHELVRCCEAAGFIMVEGQALAWTPVDAASTDDYLQRLSGSRRKDIRRKLKKRDGLQIDDIPTGSPCFSDPVVLAEYYALYHQVFAQSAIHFDLLTPAFFHELLQDAANSGVVFSYRRDGKLIGYNICFVVGDTLVDKYIGLHYPEARENNLYFISWFHNLDYARDKGLTRYIAGWTDPEIKAALGAQFTFTRHAVYIRNPLVRAVLRRLSRFFENDRDWRERHQAVDITP